MIDRLVAIAFFVFGSGGCGDSSTDNTRNEPPFFVGKYQGAHNEQDYSTGQVNENVSSTIRIGYDSVENLVNVGFIHGGGFIDGNGDFSAEVLRPYSTNSATLTCPKEAWIERFGWTLDFTEMQASGCQSYSRFIQTAGQWVLWAELCGMWDKM